MNYFKLKKLENKLYFKIIDVANLLNISYDSAKVLCSRYIKKGIMVRLKKDFYITKDKWDRLELNDFLILSNFLQVPSYISLLSALSYYEICTLQQQNFIENIGVNRTIQYNINQMIFNYSKININLYFGFIKTNNIFIAEKEKALLDIFYLQSLGKYNLDFSTIDFKKFNLNKIQIYMKKFPVKTQRIAKKLCRI